MLLSALLALLLLGFANGHPRSLIQSKNSQLPADDGDSFEYGDKERAISSEDSSDFSLHQFLANDDGRQGSIAEDDDSGAADLARSQALAADDHFNSEDTPDNSDAFAQLQAKMNKAKRHKRRRQSPDDSDDFEYGDKERAVTTSDSSDFSIHQFLNVDDGREGSSVVDDDSGDAEMARSRAMAADDHFNSEDTPDTTDSFAQTAKGGRQLHAKMNQAARHGKRAAELVQSRHRRQPDDGDSFEYGDKEVAVSAADSSDFSMHQFLNADDGREGISDTDDDSGATEMARSRAMAADDHFNSEDTPDSSDALVQTVTAGQKNSKRHLRGRHKGHDAPNEEEDSTGYVYGDSEANARNSDSSDFSVHQFLARDEGREGFDSSADDEASSSAGTQKSASPEENETFDSEDTPDTALAQVKVSK